MKVTYTASGKPDEFDIESGEDLREITREIEQHLLERHPDLRHDKRLPVTVADSVLNSIAEERGEIALGDLARQD